MKLVGEQEQSELERAMDRVFHLLQKEPASRLLGRLVIKNNQTEWHHVCTKAYINDVVLSANASNVKDQSA